jgi:RHS repeat-associated protein
MQGPAGPICRINETQQTEGYYPAGVTSNTPLGRGVTHWYVCDGLGSVIAELDDNNNMTTSGLYDVYGAPRANTQQGVAATSSQCYVGSLGHVTDASTGGLIYMQARYYDPSLGRFISEDPKKQGGNCFLYAEENPVNKIDSTGKASSDIVNWSLELIWCAFAEVLLDAGIENMKIGWANIGEGNAAIIYGEAAEQAGLLLDLSMTGQLLGSSAAVAGVQMQCLGASTVQTGIMEMLTGVLELFAAEVIMATSDDLADGSASMAESAFSMATQTL